MSWLIPLLAGLAIGWFIELMIDYFYWRSKRICTDAEAELKLALDEATASQMRLQGEVETLTARVERMSTLETRLQSKEAALEDVQMRLREREAEIARLRGQEQQAREQQQKFNDVEALLRRQEGEIAQLTVELNELMNQNAQLSDLRSRLRSKETEVEHLKQTLLTFTRQPASTVNQTADAVVPNRPAPQPDRQTASTPFQAGAQEQHTSNAARDQLQLIWGIVIRCII